MRVVLGASWELQAGFRIATAVLGSPRVFEGKNELGRLPWVQEAPE